MPKILIADDSNTMRSVTKVHLMGLGYEFVEAEDGGRAYLLAKIGRFDLALIDYQMPQLTGLEILEKIRAEKGDVRTLPIVLLTATHEHTLRARAQALGVSGFVRKPVSGPELVSVVGRLLGDRVDSQAPPALTGVLGTTGRVRP
jgi:CheY-like chemotaxis protein